MLNKFTAIIVDDETSARDYLHEIIKMNNLRIEVVEKCSDLPKAINAIRNHKPEIVFMDIEMPKYNGLQLMDFKEESWEFNLVFTTAYNQYTIDALRIQADDYLLKPIQPEDLESCLHRIAVKKNIKEQAQSYISVKTHKTLRLINISHIMYAEASGMYSYIFLNSGEKVMASRPLKSIEEELTDSFMRIHRSFLVNVNYVKAISNIRENVITLKNKTELPIARKNRSALKEKLEK